MYASHKPTLYRIIDYMSPKKITFCIYNTQVNVIVSQNKLKAYKSKIILVI